MSMYVFVGKQEAHNFHKEPIYISAHDARRFQLEIEKYFHFLVILTLEQRRRLKRIFPNKLSKYIIYELLHRRLKNMIIGCTKKRQTGYMFVCFVGVV